jgi:hypothetical protein
MRSTGVMPPGICVAATEVAAAASHALIPKEMDPVIKAVQARLQAKSLRAEGLVIRAFWEIL